MKTFKKFRQDTLTESFLTQDEARAAYRQGVAEGTIGKCPKCGSPNLGGLIAPDFESRKCVDCGKVSDQWRIPVKEDAPTNNVGGGNVAGLGVGPQGEPGVSPKYQRKRKQLGLINGPAVDPRMFADKIFRRKVDK